MKEKLVECIPNISEGRDQLTLQSIASEIQKSPELKFLHIDSHISTHRTVITFIEHINSIEETVFRFIATSLELIDMRRHQGIHPRLGAIDVVPFVPLIKTSMNDCIQLAHRLGKRVGEELQIPVYMYAQAAKTKQRFRLYDIRKGEYEGLPKKLLDPAWKPDYGPAHFVPQSGAITIGARELMIAYNIHLETTNASIAQKIAAAIRESGNGKKLKGCQAIGWFIPEYECAQVSTNLHDVNATPLHVVFEACTELAQTLGTKVTGSEIVGMAPKQALIEAGKYFAQKQGKKQDSEKSLISLAVEYFGLDRFRPFDPQQKIIEKKLKEPL